jgi:hypothetical protein
MYTSQLVKTRDLHPGLLINHHPVSFLSLAAHLLPLIRLLSSLISPLFFIYLLSILVEVLLCLLTYRGDLVLLYLVPEDQS